MKLAITAIGKENKEGMDRGERMGELKLSVCMEGIRK
jgi:hypothetical protein